MSALDNSPFIFCFFIRNTLFKKCAANMLKWMLVNGMTDCKTISIDFLLSVMFSPTLKKRSLAGNFERISEDVVMYVYSYRLTVHSSNIEQNTVTVQNI